jgi:hypothetical protein
MTSLTKLDRRIYRADFRRRTARDAKWEMLWRGMFYRFVNERNARAMVGLVRHPGCTRDVQPGLRQLGQWPVEATSGKQSTTVVVGMEVTH